MVQVKVKEAILIPHMYITLRLRFSGFSVDIVRCSNLLTCVIKTDYYNSYW